MLLFRPFTLLFELILTLLFPDCCCICKQPFTRLCNTCKNNLDFCLPFDAQVYYPSIAVTAVCRFTPLSRNIIHCFKYIPLQPLAIDIAHLLFAHATFPKTDYITSVPPDPKRKKQRGFDHTQALALEVARLTKTPYRSLFEKKSATRSQASTGTKEQRKANMARAFTLLPTAEQQLKPHSTVLIIDDVCTTGTTLETCTALLEKHKVTAHCLVFALRI